MSDVKGNLDLQAEVPVHIEERRVTTSHSRDPKRRKVKYNQTHKPQTSTRGGGLGSSEGTVKGVTA